MCKKIYFYTNEIFSAIESVNFSYKRDHIHPIKIFLHSFVIKYLNYLLIIFNYLKKLDPKIALSCTNVSRMTQIGFRTTKFKYVTYLKK